MNVKLRSAVMATLTSTFLLGFGSNAMADSTYDLVQALVDKGVLTEEEAIPLLKSREADNKKAEKDIKKDRLSTSSLIDNAKLYGDVRVRMEQRQGDQFASSNDETRTRGRYKLTFGVKTEADDFYTDLAFAMGGKGSSDNATFGSTSDGLNTKESLFVKRAMIGWNATDWLTLEAGRLKNPLYTQPMVWDGDFTLEGLVEKVTFQAGPDTTVFGNFAQVYVEGDDKDYNYKADDETNVMLAFQGGVEHKFSSAVKAKAGLTYTTYTEDDDVLGGKYETTSNVKTIEFPAEVSFKTDGTIGYKVFGDYVKNLDGDERCKVLTTTCVAGDEDNAWLVGGEIKSVQDPKGKKSTKGDWKAKIWYQSVGAFSVNPEAVDSDFMDSRVNMEGVIFKGEYALRDNVFLSLAYGQGDIKEDQYKTYASTYATVKGDIDFNLDSFDLLQLDMTYKF
jgi:polyhydroxyalkanoate synthesis regulator phasin